MRTELTQESRDKLIAMMESVECAVSALRCALEDSVHADDVNLRMAGYDLKDEVNDLLELALPLKPHK
jgi:hypothetical protein